MSEGSVLKLADARIEIIAGERRGLSINLDEPRLIIGRELDCGLQLPDDLCSRHHAVILCDEYTVRIRDLGSRNGTFVNGMQIQSTTILNEFDKVRIGHTTMAIRRNYANEFSPTAETRTDAIAPEQTKILF
jgi:pSer/pThr/pTyr-binding forkhead associated (FHA) protein